MRDSGQANLAAYLRFATAAKGGKISEGDEGFGFAAPFPLRHPMVTGWLGDDQPRMDVPSFWWWRSSLDTTLGELHELPALATRTLPPPALDAVPISTASDANQYLVLLERSFENIPTGFGDMIFLPAAAILDERVTAYGVWVAGELAAGAIAFTADDVAGLYWAATDPKHRRQGYGAACALHALRATGAHTFVCQASRDGLPVWERLGFERTHTYARYLI
jgi:GNAT superfamily N-acetyltransferase